MGVAEKHRGQRAKQTAEVFTPDSLVCEMLSKLPKEVWLPGKTFCDPAVGNGQFLIWVFIRKLSLNQSPLDALKTLYGVDLFQENVNECRLRLLKIVQKCREPITEEHVRVVLKNIFWVRPDVYPRGSLDYDFEFNHEIRRERVEQYMEWIRGGILNKKSPEGQCHIHIPSTRCLKNMEKWFKGDTK